ncbi:hypothetical protein THAOC_01531, partial [Thalassiosira oceanica]
PVPPPSPVALATYVPSAVSAESGRAAPQTVPSQTLSCSLQACIDACMMSTNEVIKRRRLGGFPGDDDVAAGQDDAVSRLEQRMNLMEASFQREILEVKRAAAVELHAKTNAIESRLSSLQDETDKLKARVSQLDEENRRLEAAFKLHVKNSDWEYTAPDPPPNSYWIEKGYDYGDEDITDENYIDNINSEFFWRAKQQSKMLRSGICGLDDHATQFYFGDGDNDSPLIRYDDSLLPHWVEFRNSMRTWLLSSVRGTIEQTHPFHVYICYIELPAIVLQELGKCFTLEGLGHVEVFCLETNGFQGSDGIDFALQIIQSQKKMIDFCFDRNPVDNHQDCQRLVDAIAGHPNISDCDLVGLCGGEINGHDYLVHILRKEKLQTLDFSNNSVTTAGQSTLFDIIKLHPNLVCLRLDHNHLNDEDAIHLAGALRYNRTLETLWLKGNRFTRMGVDILKKVMYDDSSLNAVADSNHVCIIEGMGFHLPGGSGYYYVRRTRKSYDPKQSRARKIFHLLSQRNKQGTNAHHLEAEMGGDTLKVVPLALAAIQVYKLPWNRGFRGAAGAKLSIMYELVRSWNVTILDIHKD